MGIILYYLSVIKIESFINYLSLLYLAKKEVKMSLRDKLNQVTKRTGNSVYSGLGDILTQDINPKYVLGVVLLTGSLALSGNVYADEPKETYNINNLSEFVNTYDGKGKNDKKDNSVSLDEFVHTKIKRICNDDDIIFRDMCNLHHNKKLEKDFSLKKGYKVEDLIAKQVAERAYKDIIQDALDSYKNLLEKDFKSADINRDGVINSKDDLNKDNQIDDKDRELYQKQKEKKWLKKHYTP